MKFSRFAGNPILSPHPDHDWEDLAVFNPAAWYDEQAGEVLLLYRAAESGPEYKCYFGLAKSNDGFHFERVSDRPVLHPSVEGFDGATIQDPRMVKIGDWFCIAYACRHYPFGQFWTPKEQQRYHRPECPREFPRYLRISATRTGLLLTRDFKTSSCRRPNCGRHARKSRRSCLKAIQGGRYVPVGCRAARIGFVSG
jgi:predicted GH43/DUF377 family glycosyl hydrolase